MARKKTDPDSLTVVGHLEDLRGALVYCLGFWLAATALALFFSGDIVRLLKLPAAGRIATFVVVKPTEAVTVTLKVALFAGALLSSPLMFHRVWRFIAPALGATARSVAVWVFALTALFAGGVAFSYFAVLPVSLGFLAKLSEGLAVPMITLGSYVSFVLAVLFLGGVMFEMPLISALLTKAGIVSPGLLRSRRKEAVFGLCVLAAVLTPTTDIFSMLLFTAPMIALYEFSIIVSQYLSGPRVADMEEIYGKQ